MARKSRGPSSRGPGRAVVPEEPRVPGAVGPAAVWARPAPWLHDVSSKTLQFLGILLSVGSGQIKFSNNTSKSTDIFKESLLLGVFNF